MLLEQSLLSQLDEGLDAVEEQLRQVILTDVDILEDASKHIVESGGKRLRPNVTLLSYLAAGGQDIAEAVPLAAAIELVHTATLVHDDINDHSLTRRGKISVHARWGRTFALLTGDYLFTKVYELMAPYGADFNVIMANACVKLVEGETLQAEAAKNGAINQEIYKTIVSRKTASLFEAASRMGALIAGADEMIVKALADYGYNLGLAFQIVDDVLDIIGDPQTLGKPIGSDVVQGTGAIMAHNGKKARNLEVAPEVDPIKEMLAKLRDSGAVDIALAQAREWANRSRKSLSLVPYSLAREELDNLVKLVIERER
ncbi:MAG: polyprenyl synthetase family protein [Chloroflexota bacterium]|jgi:geranylgeranyl pyrophosphate synthase